MSKKIAVITGSPRKNGNIVAPAILEADTVVFTASVYWEVLVPGVLNAGDIEKTDGCTQAAALAEKLWEKGKIELAEVESSAIKIPVHSRVAIQCSLKEYHEVGDHYLYICNVEQVYGDANEEALFAWNGYGKVAPAKQSE